MVDRHIFVGQCSKELDLMLPDSHRLKESIKEAQSCPLSHVRGDSSHGFENKVFDTVRTNASNQCRKAPSGS